jgi:hypothetical protein
LLPLASRSAFNPGVQVCAPASPPSVISGLIRRTNRAAIVPMTSGNTVTIIPASRILMKKRLPLACHASTACGPACRPTTAMNTIRPMSISNRCAGSGIDPKTG